MDEGDAKMVRGIACRLSMRLGGRIDWRDLYQEGIFGLMQARLSFQPSRGLRFGTYASPRIRGAMLDALRKWDHLPRSLRDKVKRGLALDIEFSPLDDADCSPRLGDEPASSFLRGVDNRDECEGLLRALTRRERIVVRLYFLEGLRQREVAQALGLSEGRISQILAKSLRKMRRHAAWLGRREDHPAEAG